MNVSYIRCKTKHVSELYHSVSSYIYINLHCTQLCGPDGCVGMSSWCTRARQLDGIGSLHTVRYCCRSRSEPDGTRWLTGGEVKGKLANGVGSQYSHATSKRGLSSITKADTHTSAASSRLNWRPQRFKWTRPFWGKEEILFLRVCHHVPHELYLECER